VEAFVRRSYELVRANLSKKQQGVLIAQEAPVATPVARPARTRKR
jgi:hypothetical protein